MKYNTKNFTLNPSLKALIGQAKDHRVAIEVKTDDAGNYIVNALHDKSPVFGGVGFRDQHEVYEFIVKTIPCYQATKAFAERLGQPSHAGELSLF